MDLPRRTGIGAADASRVIKRHWQGSRLREPRVGHVAKRKRSPRRVRARPQGPARGHPCNSFLRILNAAYAPVRASAARGSPLYAQTRRTIASVRAGASPWADRVRSVWHVRVDVQVGADPIRTRFVRGRWWDGSASSATPGGSTPCPPPPPTRAVGSTQRPTPANSPALTKSSRSEGHTSE